MDPRAAPLAEILRLNTRLFRNCLDGLTEEQARSRPSPATNSAAFVAAHVADARYWILRELGAAEASPLDPYLADARGIDDIQRWPSLDEIQAAWTTAAHALRDRLEAMSPADFDAPTAGRYPVGDRTVLGAFTFLVQHDSYHVGQLALLRKHAGHPGMRYG